MERRVFPKVVGIGGKERSLVDDAIFFIRERALSKDLAALNHQRFLAPDDDLSSLSGTLETVPFLSERRLLEIHGADRIDAATSSYLLSYVKNPSPQSLLMLIFNKVDKRNKLVSTLFDQGWFLLFDLDSDDDRLGLMVERASSLGLELSRPAQQCLLMMADGDLLLINGVLDKLALTFSGDEITVEDIEQHMVGAFAKDVFLLARYISEGNLSDALIALGRLREGQESPLKFLGVLIWQFRTLLKIRHCLEQGLNDWEIRKRASVYGERYAWMQQAAKKKNKAFHQNRLTRLMECDLLLKTTAIEPFSLIERVIYQSVVGL